MRVVPVTFFFLLSFSAVAQELKHDTRYPGYFINAKYDTIRGFILVTNKHDNQKIGEYTNDAKGQKIKIHLLPNEIHGFKVQDRIYTSLLYGDPDPLAYHFLLTLDEGYLKLYQYFFLPPDLYVNQGNSTRLATGYDEQYLQFEFVIIKKDNSQIVISSQSMLQKKAGDLFGDNEELLKKIEGKEKGYKFNDLPAIMKEYNEWKLKS